MALLEIQTGEDNQVLRTKSEAIQQIDKKMGKFLDNMKETMLKKDGIGLAAPQVGRNIRVIVCALNPGTPEQKVIEMINPEIISRGGGMELAEEGCLSLPGIFDNVERHKEITVKFLDRKGGETVLNLSDLNARIIQHEVDHLDGILFIDRVKKESVLIQPDISHPHFKI
jgi:peptide deformylase